MNYSGEFRRNIPPNLDTRSGLLEARHLQMTWSAENQPDDFETLSDGRLRLFDEPRSGGGPYLGRIDFWPAVGRRPDGTLTTDLEILARSDCSVRDGNRHVSGPV